MRSALHPEEVQATIRSLLRTAASWLASHEEGSASLPRAADEDLLRRISLLVAKHDVEVPLHRVGRSVLRRRDLAVASVVEQVAAVFRSAQAGRLSVPETTDAISSSLLRVTSKDVGTPKLLEWMKLASQDSQGLKDWVSEHRGPLEAAIALVQRFADRGRARRLLQAITQAEPVPEGAGDDRLLGLAVEAQARGRVVGTVAIVKTTLAALGFTPAAAEQAVSVLFVAQRKEQVPRQATGQDATRPSPKTRRQHRGGRKKLRR